MNRQAYAIIYYVLILFIFLAPARNMKAYHHSHTSEFDHCVSGHVWIDEDRDGKQQENEKNLIDVLIHLYDFTANKVDTTLTDAEGNFLFEDLGARQYMVEIIHPFGYEFLDTTFNRPGPIQITLEATRCTAMDGGIQAAMILSENAVSVTNIQLEPFYVSGEPFSLKLRWVTDKEIDTQGFDILRSTTGKYEDAIKVNTDLILAKGSGEYEYYDKTILPVEDVFYSYWLSEIEFSGLTSDYGPVHRDIDIAQYNIYGYFLPLVMQ